MTPSSRHMQSNANCVMSQQLPHYATLVRKKYSVKHTRMIHKSIWAIFTAPRKQKGENVLCKYDSCFIHSLAKGSVGGGSLGGDCCALSVSPEQPSTSQHNYTHTHTRRIQTLHSIKHAQSEHWANERGNSISFSANPTWLPLNLREPLLSKQRFISKARNAKHLHFKYDVHTCSI